MTLARNTIALSILVGTLSIGMASQAADLSSGLTMKPLQGVSFDVGTKRAVSYFLRDDGRCKLVLTLAEAPKWDDSSSFTAARFEAAVRSGSTTRYHSADGVAVDFACQTHAQSVRVQAVERVAAAPIQ